MGALLLVNDDPAPDNHDLVVNLVRIDTLIGAFAGWCINMNMRSMHLVWSVAQYDSES